MEYTVVLIKPDGVRRGLTGEILARFERMGLKIVALKMVWVKGEILEKHYTGRREYLETLGKKTLETYEKYGKDPGEDLGTKDPYELGKIIRGWLIDFMGSGPVVAALLSGRHAVDNACSLAGPTIPVAAPTGTIRGDFSTDSPAYANLEKRPVFNLVHVSGTVEEAEFERKLWFREDEVNDYKRVDVE